MNLTFERNFIVFPEDTNSKFPMLFGGKLAAEMDICSSLAAKRLLYGTPAVDVVTVNMGGKQGLNFYKGAYLGDVVYLKATVTKLGTKSITAFVEGTVEREDGSQEKLCDGEFIFVSRDQRGNTVAHGLKLED